MREVSLRFVYSGVHELGLVNGFIAEICVILGQRSEGLSKFVTGYLEYLVHITGYYYVMTDKRPGILQKPVTIYEQE
ncbi:MAG TPA: DUF4389 domain-containing protein [Methanomicrobia archaeon]|nr:DUF4389 domain-containing protein [Methanomicrobia archaeon]